MKKIYTILLVTIATVCIKAASYTITTVGTTYSPNTLTVSIGDVVTIDANPNHPLAEVSQTTWAANGTTTLSTGFGNKSSNYTFTISSTNSIYYVCVNHVASFQMKGQITVAGTTAINEQNNAIGTLSLFPNPAKDKFSVKFNSTENGIVSAKLYSVCGQEIPSIISNKDFNVGINTINFELQNNIPSGIYFIQLDFNSKKIVRKLIID